MKSLWLILVFCVLGGGGCFSSEEKEKNKTDKPFGVEDSAKAALPVPPEDLKTLVNGNNQFAFDLYHQLSQKPGNKFFSPYSISTAPCPDGEGHRLLSNLMWSVSDANN